MLFCKNPIKNSNFIDQEKLYRWYKVNNNVFDRTSIFLNISTDNLLAGISTSRSSYLLNPEEALIIEETILNDSKVINNFEDCIYKPKDDQLKLAFINCIKNNSVFDITIPYNDVDYVCKVEMIFEHSPRICNNPHCDIVFKYNILPEIKSISTFERRLASGIKEKLSALFILHNFSSH